MTAKQILGLFFISLPFLTMFGIYIYMEGIQAFLTLIGILLALTVPIVVGEWLLR